MSRDCSGKIQRLIIGVLVSKPTGEAVSGSKTRYCVVCGASIHRGATKYCGAACYRIVQRSGSVEARFWSKVNKNGPIHPVLGTRCWLWTASHNTDTGYGQFTWAARYGRARPVTAHRVAWELTHGPIPEGQSVLHVCDVPLCVNAEAHHFLGTQLDNMRDAASKGRLHAPRPRNQKLTSEQVALIRRRAACGELQIHLAREFSVTKSCVSQLVKGTRRKFDGKAVA